MKTFIIAIQMILNLAPFLVIAQDTRNVTLFNFDWKFEHNNNQFAHTVDFNDSDWNLVQLPHDASIYGDFDKENSTAGNGWRPFNQGWYRKWFKAEESWQGKKVFVEFEGVYRDASVWCNGKFIGTNLNGYLGFEVDITSYLKAGEDNLIAVHFDNREKGTSRWYTGEGIYRDVWLKVLEPVYIPNNGTYVTTPIIHHDLAIVAVQTEIKNETGRPLLIDLISEVIDPNGKKVGSYKSVTHLASDELHTIQQDIEVLDPQLWDIKNPNLYKLLSKVLVDNVLKDEYKTTFGIREIRMTPEKGLLLNGRKVVAKGGDLHHDLICLGAAAFKRGYEKHLQELKDMGCNSVRLSHNPHASVLLDLCDSMGILVISESYDKWTSQFNGGKAAFANTWEKDMTAFIRRDRNHPSVYIWSVGNEVLKQMGVWDQKFEGPEDASDYGVSVLRNLVNLTHKLDPSRKVTCALFPLRETGFREWTFKGSHEEFLQKAPPPMAFNMDVVSWNYTENMFDIDHKNYPQMMFIGSEIGTNLGHKNRDISWFEMDTSYLVGAYYWTAYAYLGESPWPRKGWNRAFFDIGEEKTAIGYMFQSFFDEKPMVHIMVYEPDKEKMSYWDKQYGDKRWSWYPMSDHWNWAKFKTVKLCTFNNCEEVELFLNGRSLGIKKKTDYMKKFMNWEIPYQEGELKAVGRINGEVVTEHQIVTAGSPARLILEADRPTINADGIDLSYIKVKIVDKNGVIVPNADRMVEFEVDGAGSLAGVSNSNVFSDELFQSKQRSTIEGKCLLVVRSGREKGTITITAKAKGLPFANSEVKVF